MKAIFLLLSLIWFSETSSLTSRPSLLQNEKEPSRTNLGVYPNPKIMENGNLFSPRMDYDEWTPLGRGDPLKNDPTYDYVPPVLERVHYWMDPSKRTPDPPLPNSGVLVVGSRTESTFTTRPTTPRYQVFQSKESQADSRIDTSSLLDPFFKLMDASQFSLNFNSNGNNNHYKPMPNRIQRPQYQSVRQRPQTQPPQALQRPPYTMLMPPPPPHPASQSITNFITTQVAMTSDRTESQLTTSPTAPTVQTVPTTPTTSSVPLSTKNVTTINPTVLANTENVFKPVAIAMPGQVEPMRNESGNEVKTTIKFETPPKKPTTESSSMAPSTVTTFNNKKPSKGDESKLLTTDRGVTHSSHHYAHPTTVKYVKEKPKESVGHQVHLSQSENTKNYLSEILLQSKEPNYKGHHHTKSQGSWNRENELRVSSLRATTAPTITTTKINVLTTDSMFKHYKQPSEPVKGPFYLIIQGHSKVKTYGANKNPINRLLTSNEIKYDDEERKKGYSGKYERKIRRLSYDPLNHDLLGGVNKIDDLENYESEEIRRITLSADDNAESLEETFGKSNGGSSKKRYLGSKHRRKRSVQQSMRRLLSVVPEETTEKSTTLKVDCGAEGRNATGVADNLDLESLIAISDDYDPEDVASILLKEEGAPGSGFGGFAGSLFARSETEVEEV